MTRWSVLAALLAAVAAAAITASASGWGSSKPGAACDGVILRARSGTQGGYRVVLGVVSVPRAYNQQVVRSNEAAWPWWRKAGLVVRGGAPTVTVSVPPAWRRRAAITWGSGGRAVVVRIPSCPRSSPDPEEPWDVYSGGFYLRSRSACVPLLFRVGGRSATVRFGLGRRC